VIELRELNVELDDEVYRLKQQLGEQAKECNPNTKYDGPATRGFVYEILEGLRQPETEYNKM
jgi:hypothetical protein